jgi:hypothetical protein
MLCSCSKPSGDNVRPPPIAAALVLAIGLLGLLGLCAGGAAGAGEPVLAGPWSRSQEGYGHAKPMTVFNGGDPTGLVRRIHWSSWGGPQALGTGVSDYVGAHQSVAEGTPQPVKIVAFQLGLCHGRRAYDAIEWYFPQHGQRFNAHVYINDCTGSYHQ